MAVRQYVDILGEAGGENSEIDIGIHRQFQPAGVANPGQFTKLRCIHIGLTIHHIMVDGMTFIHHEIDIQRRSAGNQRVGNGKRFTRSTYKMLCINGIKRTHSQVRSDILNGIKQFKPLGFKAVRKNDLIIHANGIKVVAGIGTKTQGRGIPAPYALLRPDITVLCRQGRNRVINVGKINAKSHVLMRGGNRNGGNALPIHRIVIKIITIVINSANILAIRRRNRQQNRFRTGDAITFNIGNHLAITLINRGRKSVSNWSKRSCDGVRGRNVRKGIESGVASRCAGIPAIGQ